MRRRTLAVLAVAALVSACSGDTSDTIRAEDEDGSSNETVVRGDDEEEEEAPVERTTTTRAPRRAPLEVAGHGFTQMPPDSIGNSYMSYGVVIKNPNLNEYAEDVRVNITMLDAAGAVVNSESDSIALILPGQEVAIGANTGAAGVAKLDVQVLGEDWSKQVGPVGTFTTEGVQTRPDQYFGYNTTGTIVSTFAKNLENVQATAIYRNAEGAIIGGQFTYVDFVPAGGRIGFEISQSEKLPGVAATNVYVALTTLALFAD